MRYITKPILLFFMILIFSACGGGGDDTGVPAVNLTVDLNDVLGTGSTSGHEVQITDGGDIDFTCFQSGSFQGATPNPRCGTEPVGNNQAGGNRIIFSSLPTGRIYTLNSSSTGGGIALETCTVTIQTTTELSAVAPCVEIGTNRIRIDINPND